MSARLAERGHLVIATVRDLKKSGPLADEVKHRGGKAEIFALDVTDKAAIGDLVKEIGARYGYVDVLINNAGYGVGGFFED